MKPINKTIIPTFMLLMTMALAYGLPKHKNESSRTTAPVSLNLPQTLPGWNTEDVSDEIDLVNNLSFLGPIMAKEYDQENGPLLYFFIVDAVNYHRPKTCVGGAGFDVQGLEDIEFKLPNHTWKAKAVYFQRVEEGYLTVYWICVNKMVRIDVTATSDQIGQATQTIQQLLTNLAAQITPEEQNYLFGK